MFTEVFIEYSRINIWVSSNKIPQKLDYDEDENQPQPDQDDDEEEDDDKPKIVEVKKEETTKPPEIRKTLSEDDQYFADQASKPKENETLYYPCDKKSDLFVLQRKFVLDTRRYSLDSSTNGSR
jgi:hypothetical protein